MNTDTAKTVDSLYTVKAGDSLSKIATAWYGDANEAQRIASRNNISLQHILYIGQRLILPATASSVPEESTMPSSPGGSVPTTYNGEVIETVTTTASRLVPWYQDWRYLAALGLGIGAIYWIASRKRR